MALKTRLSGLRAAAGLFPHFFSPNSSVFGRFDGLNFQTEKPFQNVSATRASPVAAALGKNAESFNLIDTCSKQAATGYSLELLNCIAEETVAPFAVPRTGSKVVLRHENAGPKMGPFSEPSRNVPILRGTKNGSEFRANFWPCSSFFFLNSQFQQNDHNLSLFLRSHSTPSNSTGQRQQQYSELKL